MESSSGPGGYSRPEGGGFGHDQPHSGVDWQQLGNLASHISSRGGPNQGHGQLNFDDIQRM
jgi:hypothetical protein